MYESVTVKHVTRGKTNVKQVKNVLVSFMWPVTRKKERDATGTVFYPVKLYKPNTGEDRTQNGGRSVELSVNLALESKMLLLVFR